MDKSFDITRVATLMHFYDYNEYTIEITIDDKDEKIFIEIIDTEKKNDEYRFEVNLPEGVYLSDLLDSFEKRFFDIKEENGKLIVIVIFNNDGKQIISEFLAEPLTSNEPLIIIEEDVKGNDDKIDLNNLKKKEDKNIIGSSDLNHFIQNNLIQNKENPALINLNVINDQNLNHYERIHSLSKNLFNIIKHDEKYVPQSFVSDDEMEKDIKEKGLKSSPYFPILVLKRILENCGITALVERHCTQPELTKELLQIIVSGLGCLPLYEFHLDYGIDRNKEILTNKTEGKKYIEEMKEYFSKELKIDKKIIFITNFRKGSVKFNAFFGKLLDNEEIERLKKKHNANYVDEGIKFGELLLKYCKLSPEMFDAKGNNFTGWAPKGREKRGNEPYDPPENNGNYYGFGLKVLGQYDNGDNTWLGMENKPGEFCVAYHGVGRHENYPFHIVGNIIDDKKLKPGDYQLFEYDDDIRHKGNKCGRGVYFTPIIKEAEKYAGDCFVCGNYYQAIFMCRVNRKKIREPKKRPAYWILSGKPDEVRPYRIIILDEYGWVII